jgi:tetratricopeptide (TPR) repeat protein
MHMGGEGHQFHAMDFLVYAYLQTGREQDAQKIIDEVRAMPPMKDMYGMGFDPRFFALSAYPASYALELHDWSAAAQLPPVEGADDFVQSITYTTRAIAAGHEGNVEQIKKEIAKLEEIQKKLESKKKNDQGEYEAVSDELVMARGWLEFAQGNVDSAVKLLSTIADKEQGEAESSQGVPTHEMIGDMLMQAKRPEQALAQYEMTLKTNPGRFNALYGAATASAALGKNDKARDYYAQIVKNCADSKSERAELKHAREEADRLARASATLAPRVLPAHKPKAARPKIIALNSAEINRVASS